MSTIKSRTRSAAWVALLMTLPMVAPFAAEFDSKHESPAPDARELALLDALVTVCDSVKGSEKGVHDLQVDLHKRTEGAYAEQVGNVRRSDLYKSTHAWVLDTVSKLDAQAIKQACTLK